MATLQEGTKLLDEELEKTKVELKKRTEETKEYKDKAAVLKKENQTMANEIDIQQAQIAE